MMIDTAPISGSDPSTLATWLNIEPDRYLDARRPAWQAHERAGMVRCERLHAERRARVYIDPSATEIIVALFGPRTAESSAATPPPARALSNERQ